MKRVAKVATLLFILYLAACTVAGLSIAELTLRPIRLKPDREAFAEVVTGDYHSQLQDVSIAAADGVELRAWYVRPANDNHAAVILLHGIGDSRQGMTGFARLFLHHGYRVLLPDSRAHGESGGDIATFGVRESDDISRWIQWLHAQGAGCVDGLGESMGAALVLESARSGQYCAVVAESPFSSFHQVAYDRLGYYSHTGQWFGRTVGRPIVEIALLYTQWRYGIDLTRANPADVIRHSDVPVLLIHGEKDVNILPWHSRYMARIDPHAALWLVPGAHHCGASSVAKDEFDHRVLAWFSRHSS